ncbi:hypothetical protein [Agitococcus lubricus]|uniref:Uncharacterized protein n=1 Tax=Agitococcus lubricus TaxID=1077255 RepID=A0A2T5J225_9GAMM|nr:hypothetical protein [Agitococcus lubricus]PTQ90496.1 hypothetical protein C8N29_103251 [Agitococcus lubricus]
MKKLLFILAALSSVSAYAGTSTGGTITGFSPYSSGTVEILIFKTSTLTGTPACNTTQRFAINSNNIRYSNTTAAVMTAYSANKIVQVKGLGTCNVWGNAEDVDVICVGDMPCW